MFGLGFWEIATILAVALLIFGPKKLPEFGRSLGKAIREFRRATEDFRSTIEDEIHRPDPPARPGPDAPRALSPVAEGASSQGPSSFGPPSSSTVGAQAPASTGGASDPLLPRLELPVGTFEAQRAPASRPLDASMTSVARQDTSSDSSGAHDPAFDRTNSSSS